MTEPSSDNRPTYVDPVTGQELFVDPVTGELAYSDAGEALPPTAYAPPDYALPPGPQATGGGYPASAFPPPYGYGYPGYPGYPGFPLPVPVRTSPMAIASLVVSIVGATLLPCYLIGAFVSIVGAVLGQVARRQIARTGEGGAGLALGGIIVGWVCFGLGVLVAAAAIVIFFGIGPFDND